MKKDFGKTSKNVPEAPIVTDSDDLESQLGPGGDPWDAFLPPTLPGIPYPAPGVPYPAPGVPYPAPGVPYPAAGAPDPALNGSQIEAQSNISGVIFR